MSKITPYKSAQELLVGEEVFAPSVVGFDTVTVTERTVTYHKSAPVATPPRHRDADVYANWEDDSATPTGMDASAALSVALVLAVVAVLVVLTTKLVGAVSALAAAGPVAIVLAAVVAGGLGYISVIVYGLLRGRK